MSGPGQLHGSRLPALAVGSPRLARAAAHPGAGLLRKCRANQRDSPYGHSSSRAARSTSGSPGERRRCDRPVTATRDLPANNDCHMRWSQAKIGCPPRHPLPAWGAPPVGSASYQPVSFLNVSADLKRCQTLRERRSCHALCRRSTHSDATRSHSSGTPPSINSI